MRAGGITKRGGRSELVVLVAACVALVVCCFSFAFIKPTSAFADDSIAFAVYSEDDCSLVFYYGEAPEEGDTYNDVTVTAVYSGFETTSYSSSSSVAWSDVCTEVYTVFFDESFTAVQPVSMAYWFYNFKYCSSMDLTNLDTSQSSSMKCMFYNCAKLASIEGIGELDTSNVTSLYQTFYYCSALTELDVSGWNTGNVESFYSMFDYCSALASLDLSGWDTSSATTLKYMFRYCQSLTEIDLSSWDVSNVTNMYGLFYYDSAFTSINVSGWDTSSVTNMNALFFICSSITSLDLSSWDTSNVTDTSYMFSNNYKLQTIYVSDLWSMKSVSSSGSMFYSCKVLVGGNGTSWSSSNVTDSYACIDTESNPGYLTDINATSISVGASTFVVGETVSLDASVLDVFGNVIEGAEVDIEYYADEDCATVLEYAPSDEGTYWVQLTFAGLGSYKASSVVVELTIGTSDVAEATVTLDADTYDYTGSAITPTPTVVLNGETLSEDADYTVSYANNTNTGTATVTITGMGIYTGTVTVTFTIAGTDIADATVTLSSSSYPYTGSAITPVPTVTYSTTTTTKTSTSISIVTKTVTLTMGSDYTVAYADNVDLGTATITITGCGAYDGETTITFEIVAPSLSDAVITLAATSYDYDGTAKEPAVESVVLNGTLLTAGTDYEVSGYADNTDAGTATVTVTGTGNYTGTATATFTISAKSVSSATVTLSKTSYTYDGTARKPTPTVVLDGTTLVSGTDYTVSYSSNTDAGTATCKVTGTGNYTGTVSMAFTISAKSISSATVTLSATSYTYNGSARKPTPTVRVGGATLTKGTDYTVSYSDNTDAGTATVTVTGTGNYTGTATKTFTISAKSVSAATVTLSTTSYTYNGAARKPSVESVKISLNGSTVTLDSSTDYTVSYASGRTDAGTYKVTVTGAGNYTGTATATFTISAKSVSSAMVTLSKTSYTYDGTARKPTPTVKLTLNDSTVKLTKGTDYTVSYKNNKSAGTATVTIAGTGNYKGTASKTFTIKAKSISSGTATLSKTSYTYSGSARKPSVTLKVTLNGSTKTLTKGTDYTVSYKNNTKTGKATVTITGCGNYKGTITKTFKIVPKTMTVKSAKSSAKKKATIKWSKASGSVTGYQIRYRVKGTSSWKTVTVKGASKTSYTLTGLKSGKTYQVQIRAYKTVSSSKYTGSWSSTKTVKVK